MDDTDRTRGRLFFGLGAALLLVATGFGLWRWQEGRSSQLVEVSGGGATGIYPLWGDLGPFASWEASSVRGAVAPGQLAGLTIGRRQGDTVTGLVQVAVTPWSGPTDPAGLGSPVVRLGGRDVVIGTADTEQYGGADLVVWLDSAPTPDQLATVQQRLDASPAVVSVRYRDQAAAAAEYAADFDEQSGLPADPGPLPTRFEVELDHTQGALIDALTFEIRYLPGVIQVDGADHYYQWLEAGALVMVSGGSGAEAVVTALHLTPGDGLPRISLDPLPDGLAPLAPPGEPWGGPLPSLSLAPSDGTSLQLVVSESLVQADHPFQVVSIKGAEGYLAGFATEALVAWPVPGTSLWFVLTASGADGEQVRRIAEGVTTTDQTTWEARYAGVSAAPTTTLGGVPVETTAGADGAPSTTGSVPVGSSTTGGTIPGGTFAPADGSTPTTGP